MKTKILILSLLVSTTGFSKTLFCTTGFDAPSVKIVVDKDSEALIPLKLKFKKKHLEDHPETHSSYHGADNVLNVAVGYSVMHGHCKDAVGRKFHIHMVGGGVSFKIAQSNFIISCPLVSEKRFGPVGDVAQFGGIKFSAIAGVGAEAGVFTNHALGLCVMAGMAEGLGGGIEADYLAINRIPSDKHFSKAAEKLLNLSDEQLVKQFIEGVGLMKLIKDKDKDTYKLSSRIQHSNDDRPAVMLGVEIAMKLCKAIPQNRSMNDDTAAEILRDILRQGCVL